MLPECSHDSYILVLEIYKHIKSQVKKSFVYAVNLKGGILSWWFYG